MIGRSLALRFAMDIREVQRFLAHQPIRKPYDHQLSGATFMVRRMAGELPPFHIHGGGLCDDMRTGKTETAILYCLFVLQQQVANRLPRFGRPFLILCPKDVLSVWEKEIVLVLGPDILKVVAFDTEDVPALYNRKEQLRDELREQTDVIITTISMLSISKNFLTDLLRNELTYRAVICDEAHNIHKEDTLGFQVITALQADAKWYVTGTPIQDQNSLCAALRFMGVTDQELEDLGDPNGEEMQQFAQQLVIRRTFEKPEPIPWHVIDFKTEIERHLYNHITKNTAWAKATEEEGGHKSRLSVIHNWRRFCVSPYLCLELFRNGTIELPPELVFLPVLCEQQQQQQEEEEKDDDNDMESVMGTDPSYTMLLQIAENMTLNALGIPIANTSPALFHFYQSIEKWIVPPVSSKEYWVVNELLRGNTDVTREKVVIFSNWRSSLDRLVYLFQLRLDHGVEGARGFVYVHGDMKKNERVRERERFATDPNLGMMLAMIDVNREGINLTCANHGVIYDPWWNTVPERQAISRLKGDSQTRPLFFYRLLIDDTIDVGVALRADKKKELDQKALPVTVLSRQDEEDEDEESIQVLQLLQQPH